MAMLDIFGSDVMVFMIPIVAVIVGGLIAIVKMVISHRERMAMIEQGVHPDYPPDELEADHDRSPIDGPADTTGY